jgi:hypothetical protein
MVAEHAAPRLGAEAERGRSLDDPSLRRRFIVVRMAAKARLCSEGVLRIASIAAGIDARLMLPMDFSDKNWL